MLHVSVVRAVAAAHSEAEGNLFCALISIVRRLRHVHAGVFRILCTRVQVYKRARVFTIA